MNNPPGSKAAFMPVDCGALPETLLESELFGHVKGAFTGADTDKPGLFRAAHGGTLFLHEIGETSRATQVKLLRVLQEKEVRPAGATRAEIIDVRVVAATNRDLGAMIADGNFRKDLFYRLNVVGIDIPPLRRRREDILALAREFIANANRAYGRRCTLTPEAAWAQLLKRVFHNDLLVCEKCNGKRKVIAFVTESKPIQKILTHLGLPNEPPTVAPARAPPQTEMFDDGWAAGANATDPLRPPGSTAPSKTANGTDPPNPTESRTLCHFVSRKAPGSSHPATPYCPPGRKVGFELPSA